MLAFLSRRLERRSRGINRRRSFSIWERVVTRCRSSCDLNIERGIAIPKVVNPYQSLSYVSKLSLIRAVDSKLSEAPTHSPEMLLGLE